MTQSLSILYCHCAYAQATPAEARAGVLGRLCEAGLSFTAVADLCELSGRQHPVLRRLAASPGLKIAACHPRAVKWLFAAAHAPLRPEGAQVINLRELTAVQAGAAVANCELEPNLATGEAVAQSPNPSADPPGSLAGAELPGAGAAPPAPPLLELTLRQRVDHQPAVADTPPLLKALLDNGYGVTLTAGNRAGTAQTPSSVTLSVFLPEPPQDLAASTPISARSHDVTGWPASRVTELVESARAERSAPKPGAWQAWFPVIDYDRCTSCLQCLSFCLFGVFGADPQSRIRVERAASCKTNCPACARVCPGAAIIFPKYKAGPINGQEAASAPALEKMKVDISAVLGGDVYSLLRERSQRAKARFCKERDPDAALQERQHCLRESGLLNDIPPEALAALPSLAELQERAAEARRKAAAARENH